MRQRDREWPCVHSRDGSLLSRAMSLMSGCQELSLPLLALFVHFPPHLTPPLSPDSYYKLSEVGYI